jgi:uncharacterized protein (TIGR00725 family)
MNPRTVEPIAAVIGPASPGAEELLIAESLGEALVSTGFRIVTGGLGGVMEAAAKGAHQSARYVAGATIGILPTYNQQSANPWIDIAVPTGMGHARNVVVVSTAHVVLAIGGKSGTLSEIALAWTLGKPIIAVGDAAGWANELAGRSLDDRRIDKVHGPLEAREAALLAWQLVHQTVSVQPREF